MKTIEEKFRIQFEKENKKKQKKTPISICKCENAMNKIRITKQ